MLEVGKAIERLCCLTVISTWRSDFVASRHYLTVKHLTRWKLRSRRGALKTDRQSLSTLKRWLESYCYITALETCFIIGSRTLYCIYLGVVDGCFGYISPNLKDLDKTWNIREGSWCGGNCHGFHLRMPNCVLLGRLPIWVSNVRPSTKSFFDFDEIWYIGRGRWVMHDGMPYGRIQGRGQGHGSHKVAKSANFKFYLLC